MAAILDFVLLYAPTRCLNQHCVIETVAGCPGMTLLGIAKLCSPAARGLLRVMSKFKLLLAILLISRER
jgi:hypothetical protein